MGARFGLRRTLVGLTVVGALGFAPSVSAGPWSSLPEAVATLQRDPGNRDAEAVLAAVEQSLLTEAQAGRIAATASLMEAYENLVAPLVNGEERSERVRSLASTALTSFGDRRLAVDRTEAGAAWSLAATFEASPAVLVRLRELLLPPAVAEAGDVWRSELDGAELVFVPGMQFELGCVAGDSQCRSNEDGIAVTVADIWIEKTEVTNDRYRRCVEAAVCSPPMESASWGDPSRGDEPVVGVTWRQAHTFARWAGRRLPSEAEWQRAARNDELGGRFPWGKARNRGAANVYERSGADSFDEIAEVGSFPATGHGLLDMAGNVWEWTSDRYHRSLSGAPRDGRPWLRGGWGRVLRGGSWRRTLDVARVSSRTWHEEDYFADDVGFRCVADTPDRVSPQQLIVLAYETYPLAVRPGTELADAEISVSDRDYLDLRALTWLVLEGRVTEALPRAVSLLRRDNRNPVALELLEQLEREMQVGIRRGEVVTVEAAITGYRSAVAGDRRLANRLAEHERQLAEETRISSQSFAGRGEYELAGITLEFARSLRPSDPTLDQLLADIAPSPGTRRISARDGKLMVWVPDGEYRRGASDGDKAADYDEHPAHRVVVEGFWMDATEVTNAEYARCVDAGACSPPERRDIFYDPAMADHPVLWVTWFQAFNYAKWAGKRLPSEAEWERAARGGTSARYPWGQQYQQHLVNGLRSDGTTATTGPSNVGSFPPNAWGLYDMLGNAAEWVADVYHGNYWEAPKDNRPWNQVTGEWVERRRVVRGGSYLGSPNSLRVSNREQRAPETANRAVGFRTVSD
jgi:formylglycine-generating enzyme required for sulfatase activity